MFSVCNGYFKQIGHWLKAKKGKGNSALSVLSDVLSGTSYNVPAEPANIVSHLHNRGQERQMGTYEL